MKNILELYSKRHSFYNINKDCPINFNEISDLARDCLKLYPSPFNFQSARLALLGQEAHQKFWDITKQKLLDIAPKDKADGIKTKITSFADGYGTVLYFTDTKVTDELMQKFPIYAENFKNWAYQSNAILQFMIWTAFAEKGIGANLQHYNPLVDSDVFKAFNIPPHWELTAQMPFGGIVSTLASHEIKDLENALLIL